MADNKFMPSKLLPKVGIQDSRNKGTELQSKGWVEEGLPKGYNNHVSSPVITHTDGKTKPLHDTTTDGSFITKTETIVEYTRVPMANTQGNISPSIIAPVGTTLSSSLQQSPKMEEYSKFQTEPTRSYTTSPASNLYWWRNPLSQNTVGTHEYGRPHDTGINKYHLPSDGSMHQQLHEQSPRRYEKGPHTKQESAATSIDGWDMSSIFGREAPPKGSPLNKPSNFMDTTADQLKSAAIVIVPAKGHLLPPEVSRAEVPLPSIDSREAARRYAGPPSTPVAAYAPAIDSREAAWRYRGQML